MILVRFHDMDSKNRALDRLIGRYPVKNGPTAELHVPAAALADLATEGLDFQVMGSSAPPADLSGPIIPREAPVSVPGSSCLVRIDPGEDGKVTAQLLGAPDIQATAATREEAVEQVRVLLQEQANLGSFAAIEMPQPNPSPNPLMSRFGSAKADPDFDLYLEEIRKFRKEEDFRESPVPESEECSNTFSTPTT